MNKLVVLVSLVTVFTPFLSCTSTSGRAEYGVYSGANVDNHIYLSVEKVTYRTERSFWKSCLGLGRTSTSEEYEYFVVRCGIGNYQNLSCRRVNINVSRE